VRILSRHNVRRQMVRARRRAIAMSTTRGSRPSPTRRPRGSVGGRLRTTAPRPVRRRHPPPPRHHHRTEGGAPLLLGEDAIDDIHAPDRSPGLEPRPIPSGQGRSETGRPATGRGAAWPAKRQSAPGARFPPRSIGGPSANSSRDGRSRRDSGYPRRAPRCRRARAARRSPGSVGDPRQTAPEAGWRAFREPDMTPRNSFPFRRTGRAAAASEAQPSSRSASAAAIARAGRSEFVAGDQRCPDFVQEHEGHDLTGLDRKARRYPGGIHRLGEPAQGRRVAHDDVPRTPMRRR